MGKVVSSVVSTGLMIAGVIVTGGLGTALIAAGIAVQAASSMLFKDKLPSGYRDQSERKQILRSAVAPETIIVGKTVCSGLLFFAEEEKGDQTENERLFMTLAIAAHKVERIGKIWLNDDLIGEFGDKADYEFHNSRTDCDPYMLKNAPSWKEDMIGDGLAWLRLTSKYDAEKFPYGMPNVKVEVWGKQIYDPRTGKTAWSNNGALVILDYYRSYLSVPDSDIDFEAFKVAADLCDELVMTPEGNTEPRYTINGAYELSESPASVLDHMHKCIAAEPTYVAGKHGILMQAYNGPAVLRIEPNQIIDTVNITPELGLRDATNAIYGTFVDAEQQYIQTDFEPVIVQEWVEEDGLEIKENIDYRFIVSPYQAARVTNLYLRKKRAGRRIQLKMNMDGYAYRPGDVCLLNLPHIGIQDFECRVAEWKFHPQEGVELLLEEDGPHIYEDIIGKPFVRPPFTVLPTGGVAPPLNLAFVATNIGEVVQGYLSWQSAAADVRYNTVNILENGKVIQSIQVPSDRVDLSGLVRGSYRAEVRSINAAGAMSAPAIVDFDIQAPPKPVSVEMVGGMFSLTCIPHGGETAQHGYTFEFWFSDKKLASTNDQDVTTKANRQGQGQFWTKENLKAGTDYWFYVRTVNSYGKSPFVEAVGQASGTPKDMLDELGNNFLTTEAGQKMQEQIDFNKDQVADLKIDSAVFEQKIIGIDRELGTVNEAVMMNTQFTTELHFSLKEEVADRKAEIFRIEQVQVTDREAAARWQERISAEVSYNAAEILNIKDTQASYEKATAQQISQVKADLGETNKEVGNIKGRVTTVETATADLKQAQAKFEQSTTAEFGEMRGYITNIETSLTNIEFAVSEAIMQTTAQVNETNSELLKTKAEVTRLATATATNEKATAQLVENVKAQREQSEAEFVDVRKSIAEKDKAQSERTEQVRAELGKDINANKEDIDKNNNELSKISAVVTNNTQSIATLEETTTQIKQTQQSQYDETTANIGKLTETTASNTKAITEVKEQSQSRFESNEATIANMQQTIANAESSLSEMGMQLTAEVGNQAIEQLRIKASITRLDTVTADKFQAFAQSFEKIETQFNDVNSSITTLKKSVSDNEKAQAEVNELIKSEIEENKAAIEKRAETSVDQQGNSRAYFSIKAGVLHNGQYYDVKMMMNAQVKNGQVVTQIAFAADEFIIFNNANGQFVTPFAVVNGQVFIGSGFIQDGSITNAKIGNVIQSNDFKKGEKGWQIDKNGNPEFNDGTFRGKVYATDGDFRGTVHAEKFIGDVATGVLYEGVSKYFIKQSVMSIETSIIYVGNMPYDVDLIMPTMHFASEHREPAINRPFEISVFANGVSQNVITTTVNSPDTTWAAIASCYIKIPKYQKDTVIKIRLTGRGNGGDNSNCTLRIHPALVLACKSAPSSFK
ncbi:Fibronectin type III protein [Providencia stuartii]|nr:Fibronectin type III protein [Providencia stuartii]